MAFEWWKRDENEIAQIDNQEWGITTLCARQTEDGAWEYAIVFWRYHSPTLRLLFRDGKVIEDEEQPQY